MSALTQAGKAAQTLRGTAWLRARGVRGGPVRLVGHLPVVEGGSRITLGSRASLRGVQVPVRLSTGPQGTLTIGASTFVNEGVSIHASERVTIGSHVFFADFCAVYDTNFHEVRPGAGPKVAPVTIEDDVWLGRLVTVLPGVTIGRGSVVSAHSLVTSDVPPFSIVAGNPAVVVKTLEPFGPGEHRV